MKWIALLLMVVDHVGYYFGEHLPGEVYLLLRLLGRLSFPLFAYSVAHGYIRTKNRPRYFARMFLFAAMTELAFYLTHLLTGQPFFINVMFTFSLAIACLIFIEWIEYSRTDRRPSTTSPVREEDIPEFVRSLSPLRIKIVASLGIAASILLAFVFAPDYDVYGIATVLIYYYFLRKGSIPIFVMEGKPEFASRITRILPLLGVLLAQNVLYFTVRTALRGSDPGFALLQIFSSFAPFLLLLELPGKKPKRWSKYFFYLFYPAHIVIFMLMAAYLFHK